MLNKKPKDITEEELVSALKSKNREAVGILYDRYSGFLYGIIYKIVQSTQIAEDLLQEVFVKVWLNIGTYDSSKAKLVTWMANISRNLSIDKIRSKEYKNALKNREIGDYVDIIDDSSFNPEHIGVKEMLEKLEPEYKKIIDLVYFKGYTQADTANELGIPLGTVKTRIRRAILLLREIYLQQ